MIPQDPGHCPKGSQRVLNNQKKKIPNKSQFTAIEFYRVLTTLLDIPVKESHKIPQDPGQWPKGSRPKHCKATPKRFLSLFLCLGYHRKWQLIRTPVKPPPTDTVNNSIATIFAFQTAAPIQIYDIAE